MAHDDHCYSHSAHVTDSERKAAWRSGGLASTARPLEAEVPEVPLRTRAQVSAARERVFQLVQSKIVSPPVGQTLLSALRDADNQRDRAEALVADRRPRRLDAKLHVSFPTWFKELAENGRRSLPSRPPIVVVKDHP